MRSEFLVAIVSGLLFGAGLVLSGMSDPERVRGFLDIFGNWDPTLAFVMLGAVSVMAIAWRVQRSMQAPLASTEFSIPATTRLDQPLIIGAILFGIGWGITGLCPGPALTGLVLAPERALIFIAAMLSGMTIHRTSSSKPLK